MSVDRLAECRAEERARDTGSGEHGGARPLHRSRAGMVDQVGECVDRDRQSARPDGAMRVGYSDHIEKQRHRQDRAAAADQPQREANDGA